MKRWIRVKLHELSPKKRFYKIENGEIMVKHGERGRWEPLFDHMADYHPVEFVLLALSFASKKGLLKEDGSCLQLDEGEFRRWFNDSQGEFVVKLSGSGGTWEDWGALVVLVFLFGMVLGSVIWVGLNQGIEQALMMVVIWVVFFVVVLFSILFLS